MNKQTLEPIETEMRSARQPDDQMPERPLSILCIDDEEQVLKALCRTFRHEPWQILTATTGAEGLAILRRVENIGLIMSDQRMPEMTGTTFLHATSALYPDIPRMVLTGHSDIEVATNAINQGEVYRFFTKPWEDSDLIQAARDGLHRYHLTRENRRLTALVEQKNEELTASLNHTSISLRETNERCRLLVQTMMQGVVHQDAAGAVIDMNPAAEQILGWSREEFPESKKYPSIRENGAPYPTMEHPAMVALRTGQPVQSVVMGIYNPKSAAYRWISINAVPVLLPGESAPSEVYTVFEDITNRKQADDSVIANEERLRLALDAGHLATWDWDIATDIVIWNDEHYRMLGYEPGSFAPTYRNWADRVHPEDLPAIEARIRQAMELGNEYHMDFRVLLPDGAELILEAIGRFQQNGEGDIVRSYGAMRDVTVQRLAEKALQDANRLLERRVADRTRELQESENNYRIIQELLKTIIDSSENLIWAVDPVTFGLTSFNSAFANHFLKNYGLQVEEGMHPEEISLSAHCVNTLQNFYHRVLEEGPFTTEYVTPSGTAVFTLTFNLLKRDGACFGISVFGKDITAEMAIEDQLVQAANEWRSTFDTIPDLIALIDTNYRITRMNRSMAEAWQRHCRGHPGRHLDSAASNSYITPTPPLNSALTRKCLRTVTSTQPNSTWTVLTAGSMSPPPRFMMLPGGSSAASMWHTT
jgi:PAS domain S-box-containing protein